MAEGTPKSEEMTSGDGTYVFRHYRVRLTFQEIRVVAENRFKASQMAEAESSRTEDKYTGIPLTEWTELIEAQSTPVMPFSILRAVERIVQYVSPDTGREAEEVEHCDLPNDISRVKQWLSNYAEEDY